MNKENAGEKLKKHEKSVKDIQKLFIPQKDNNISASFYKPKVSYNPELHSILIEKMMEIFNDFKTIDTFDTELVGNYLELLETLLVTQDNYLEECFEAKDNFYRKETSDERFIKLVTELKKIVDTLNSNEKKDKKLIMVLKERKKQLSNYLNEYRRNFQKRCSTFCIWDKKISSKIIEIINAFENTNYDIFEYPTVSNSPDAHGKGTNVTFYVFHPASINYEEYNFCSPSKLSSVLIQSKHDYITGTDYNSDSFKHLSYLQPFLKKLANWRFKYYFSDTQHYLNGIAKNSPVEFPIPDEILDQLTKKFIEKKQKSRQKIKQ